MLDEAAIPPPRWAVVLRTWLLVREAKCGPISKGSCRQARPSKALLRPRHRGRVSLLEKDTSEKSRKAPRQLAPRRRALLVRKSCPQYEQTINALFCSLALDCELDRKFDIKTKSQGTVVPLASLLTHWVKALGERRLLRRDARKKKSLKTNVAQRLHGQILHKKVARKGGPQQRQGLVARLDDLVTMYAAAPT